ncbi:MAG: hypothetical protein LBR77_08140 [Lachnospiraceae bacterium]|nr:hypothetical protein [Lachnospiraceae bacterium]
MKVRFDRENIEPGLTGIILLSHGPLAPAILETAEMIIGNQANVAAFAYEPADTMDGFAGAVSEAIGVFNGDAIVFTDLCGGTPSNIVMYEALKNDRPLYAIAGVNLPMFMEACALRAVGPVETVLAEAEKTGRLGIVNITEQTKRHKEAASV